MDAETRKLVGQLALAIAVPVTTGVFTQCQNQRATALAQKENERAHTRAQDELALKAQTARDDQLLKFQDRLFDQNLKLVDRALDPSKEPEYRLAMLGYFAAINSELSALRKQLDPSTFALLTDSPLSSWASRQQDILAQVGQSAKDRVEKLEGEIETQREETEKAKDALDQAKEPEKREAAANKLAKAAAKLSKIEDERRVVSMVQQAVSPGVEAYIASPSPEAQPVEEPEDTVYVHQLASMRNRDNAVTAAQRLRRQGTDARVLQRDTFYVVVSGAYPTVEDARETLPKAKSILKEGGYVRKMSSFCPKEVPVDDDVTLCLKHEL